MNTDEDPYIDNIGSRKRTFSSADLLNDIGQSQGSHISTLSRTESQDVADDTHLHSQYAKYTRTEGQQADGQREKTMDHKGPVTAFAYTAEQQLERSLLASDPAHGLICCEVGCGLVFEDEDALNAHIDQRHNPFVGQHDPKPEG